MTIPSVSIDENSPPGAQSIKLGDNRIKEFKKQNREILEVDHEYPSNGQSATAGQHKKITLQEQANLGTGAVGTTLAGSQTVGGRGEFVYTTEEDADIVITNETGINAPSITGVYAAANVATLATMMALIYPVGSVYTNAAVATNPATLLGMGTWVAIEGECIVGLVAGGTFDTLGTVAEGEETHVLLEAELAAHSHTDAMYNANGWSSGTNVQASNASNAAGNLTVSTVGSDTAHNNIQPSYVCYVWRRTV